MKTAAKVLVFFAILFAHKALVAQDNPDFTLDALVQKVNSSLSAWVPSPNRS